MKELFYTLLLSLLCAPIFGQSNMMLTNPEAHEILLGNFDPEDYAPTTVIEAPDLIAQALATEMNTDSLYSYLLKMSAFENRNTGSDTVSTTFGMGAARRWSYDKFEGFSAQHEDRLVVSYLQFDQNICGMGQHRNILAVLPGQGPQFDEVVLVEGHLDSRCENNCDVDCMAHGMEDNGSGSALVLELARVMSQFSFNRTIVFMLTTGEEQGLFGARAFAEFINDEDIKLHAVFNNDIVGGIICGATASPPGCPGLNAIDSINVRMYSFGNVNSKHKQLARFTKLQYQDELLDYMSVQQVLNIMTPEDRTGRGGDHIPFRELGYPAIRFTSANEHGDGAPSQPDYHDRQHTMEDLLGVDTNNDGELDSFFVDFNYLARNSMINGNAMAMAAMGPVPPTSFNMVPTSLGFEVTFNDPNDYGLYRIGVRDYNSNEWDTIYTVTSTTAEITGLESGVLYVLSAATVDENGVESLFSNEKFGAFIIDGVEEPIIPGSGVVLLQNAPNPFDEATMIGVLVERPLQYQQAAIQVYGMKGNVIARIPIELKLGLNEVIYDYQYHQYQPGTYAYSLVIDGKIVETKQMVYAY
jgi:hypothetical protein